MENINPRKVLVVVYSFSGTTRAAAETLIQHFDADSLVIQASQYEGKPGVWIAGMQAMRKIRTTSITPETMDMSQYELIFLGSPIWWFSPAVPLWAFAGINDFTNKSVVLFNTYNSRYREKYISEFQDLIEARGGSFKDHIAIARGSVSKHGSPEVRQELDSLLSQKENIYEHIIGEVFCSDE